MTVEEQTYRTTEGGKLCRPFQSRAEVSCRCYSTRLQRAITDFGADVPFAQVREKILEHYGIPIANGAAATITESHASRLNETDMTPAVRPAKGTLTLIAEIDGSMIPIVQTGTSGDRGPQDRRKTRKVFWKEAKLSMIRRKDEVAPLFAVTLGDTAAAGAGLMRLALWPLASTNAAMSMDWAMAQPGLKIRWSGSSVRNAGITSISSLCATTSRRRRVVLPTIRAGWSDRKTA